jgi:hypothetical protein
MEVQHFLKRNATYPNAVPSTCYQAHISTSRHRVTFQTCLGYLCAYAEDKYSRNCADWASEYTCNRFLGRITDVRPTKGHPGRTRRNRRSGKEENWNGEMIEIGEVTLHSIPKRFLPTSHEGVTSSNGSVAVMMRARTLEIGRTQEVRCLFPIRMVFVSMAHGKQMMSESRWEMWWFKLRSLPILSDP